MKDKTYQELSTLFFEMRQIIRQQQPLNGKADPNMWLRVETLRFIASVDGPTMRELAEFLRITAPSMTSLISHLEKRGLLRRSKAKEDKRTVHIHLTAKGRQELARYDARSAEKLRRVFGPLPKKDLQALLHIMREVKRLHAS